MVVNHYGSGIPPVVLIALVVDDFGNELDIGDFAPTARFVQVFGAAFDFGILAGAFPTASDGELH